MDRAGMGISDAGFGKGVSAALQWPKGEWVSCGTGGDAWLSKIDRLADSEPRLDLGRAVGAALGAWSG
ncbi:MAG: hypothetical protein WBS54_07610, partial [Acidobacteriota bacterium]